MKSLGLLILFSVFLGGCSSLVMTPGAPQGGVTTAPPSIPSAPPPAPSVPGAPAEPPAPAVQPLPPAPVVETPSAPPPPTATSALLASVDAAMQAGDLVQASAVCERALRISPRDPILWLRLAQIRQRQQRWQDVVANAKRGLLYVGSNAAVQSQLNQLLAEAERRASVAQ